MLDVIFGTIIGFCGVFGIIAFLCLVFWNWKDL